MEVVKKEIEKIVDAWTNEVLNAILSSKIKPRGIWDRFKGGLSNIWYGRDNKENPYYWKNKFGDNLGVKESFDPRAFSLTEYSFLKNTIENTEKKINEEIDPEMEKLKIVKIIKDYAQQLKNDIYNFFLKTRKETSAVASSMKTGSGQDGAVSQSVPVKSKENNDTAIKTGSGQEVAVSQSVPVKSKETIDASAKASDSTSGLSPEKSLSSSSSSDSSASDSAADKSDDAYSSSDSKEPAQSSSSVQKNTKEASELKRTNPESLSPNLSWLTKTGRIKAQKIPWAIAWLSLRPHLDINSDEDVERELKNVNLVGKEFSDAFAGLVSKNKNRKGTIIKNLKIWFSSDALLEKALKELGVEDYKSSQVSSKKSDKDIKPSSDYKDSDKDIKSSSDSKKPDKDSDKAGESESDPDENDQNMILLSSIYKDKNKQEILNSIKKKLIMPIARNLNQEDKVKLSIWWNGFKERAESNDLESLIASIKSEDLFNSIISNTGSEKINFNDLFELLKN